ncbi:MAG: peptidyl-prolyl cis-trans isomerase [candidate division WOR-3 bacterium]
MAVSCQPPALHQPTGPAVALVNSDRLTKLQVDYLAQQLQGQVTSENLPKVLEHMVTVSLLSQEAVRRGLLKDPEVLARLAWIERMFLTSELTERLTSGIEPSNAELFDYYKAHQEEFSVGLKLMLMVLPDSIVAEQTRAELVAGADFVKLAKERSRDTSMLHLPGYPTRGIGDALGWRLKDEEAVFSLRPGEVSPVIPSAAGYQIVKVVERKRITDTPRFNEAAQLYIKEALTRQRSQTVVDSLVTALRSKAKVELRPEVYFQKE